MDYQVNGHVMMLRVDRGEEVLAAITEVCQKEGIQAGSFQGIGACGDVIVSTYIASENDFTDHEKTGMLELVSLMGNITRDETDAPELHAHASFSYLNDEGETAVLSGHLTKAVVLYTVELVLTPYPNKVNRAFDEETGIRLWQINR
ncbi:DUF296 domain-containing protein [Aerococcus agrisoli]|uniref:DUF296 domain-containing protein n=1 Tax=Aerococcus agrisoli TaxID=2487350 RepID=A0A3N4GQU9_9LACT|nr:DUF296 domain-containing protein [Aerococcus agrisoli]RPA60990.1 DUF296 domain-containing protein [Aerococcus agrisoli]